MTIAIVQTAFLGDVLLTLPLCAAIRQLMPDARIVFITTPASAGFIDGLAYADDVIAFDKRGVHKGGKGLRALVAERCSNVDIALVPHTSFRTMRLVRAMRPKSVVTFNNTWTRWLPGAKVLAYPNALHDADRHLQLLHGIEPRHTLRLDALPLRQDPFGPFTKESVGRLRLYTDADKAEAGLLLKGEGAAGSREGYVVLAPGTVWPTKQWPLEYVNSLALLLAGEGNRVVLVGDASVRGSVDAHENVVDLAGRTSLRQAAALIAEASIVVANDSAPLHVASLQDVPVVGVFGPTVREFGFGPFGTHAHTIERADLLCRPCSNHGGMRCPIGTHVCMRSLTPQHVHASVIALLERTGYLLT